MTELKRPVEYGLNAKFEDYLPNQAEAILAIRDQFRSGKSVVFMDGPVGCGKSLIAVALGKLLEESHPGFSTLYTVQTKALQNQILRDFSFFQDMRGRNNFQCAVQSDLSVSEGLCSLPDYKCEDKHQICEYYQAKAAAARATSVVTNRAFFLAEVNYTDGLVCGNRNLLVIDEGHLLENAIMSFVSVLLPEKSLGAIGINLPSLKEPIDAKNWAERIYPVVSGEYVAITAKVSGDSRSNGNVNVHDMRQLLKYKAMTKRLRTLRDIEPGKWFLAQTYAGYVLKPFLVDEFVRPLVTSHSPRVLMMSATFLSSRVMTKLLGLDARTTGWHEMDSNFPKERRPYNFIPVLKLNYKTGSIGYARLAAAIDEILERHPNEKGVVHTSSFKIRGEILKYTKYPQRFLTHKRASSRERGLTRDEAIARFTRTSEPRVLISPSVGLGLDLKDDLCRFQVVAKCFTSDITFLGPDGPISIDNARIGQKVFGWNNGELVIDSVEDIYIQNYDGQVWDFKAGGYDFSATPNHDLLSSVKHRGKWGSFEKREVSELVADAVHHGKRNFRLPQTVTWNGEIPPKEMDVTRFFNDSTICAFQPSHLADLWSLPSDHPLSYHKLSQMFVFDYRSSSFIQNWGQLKKVISLDTIRNLLCPNGNLFFQDTPQSLQFPMYYQFTDWLEFLGWFVSEGSILHRVRNDRDEEWRVIVSQKARSGGAQQIKSLLERMQIPFRQSKSDFTFPSQVFFRACEHFGGKGAYNKYLAEEILRLDKGSLAILFDAMTAGDGHKTEGQWYYYTVSERLKWNVMELVYKLGYRPTLSHPRENDWMVGTARYQIRGMVLPHHRKERYYKGRVWCIRTKSGNLFAGRDSKWLPVSNCPFPSLADPQIKHRLSVDQEWYSWTTVAAIVQACGRSTRHVKDYSTCYLLDSALGQLWGKRRYLFPKWWRDALHIVKSVDEAVVAEH